LNLNLNELQYEYLIGLGSFSLGSLALKNMTFDIEQKGSPGYFIAEFDCDTKLSFERDV